MCSEGVRPAQHPAASHLGPRPPPPQQLHVLSRQLSDPMVALQTVCVGAQPASQGAGAMKDALPCVSTSNEYWLDIFIYNLVVALILQTK